ncbi:superoxide dismutase[Cu-Zn] [Nocardia camponoti]|uniref:Superoxide dismutase [Cu-Zn] n=1 Tax=Nocardia camponoti TaxID=1616106 RepID=A0A917V918_9NOCA|nr:superoxide dismutase family protein [Nocardia camponoti]GGK51733.1 superoxide dismutase [Cu-Zn] [Nocardia camponoti]
MATSTSRRPSWRTVTPVLAVAVFGLAACSNSQESTDVKGTTPPVWTSSPAPAGGDSGHGDKGHGGDHGSTTPSPNPASGIRAELKDSTGGSIGLATFGVEGTHLVVTVEAHGLKPGFHGLHIHTTGKCEGDFASAGGHLQTGAANAHPASGDLTSLQVIADGTGKLVTYTDTVTLDQIKGKSIIIHADADNFGNVPARYTREGGTGADETSLTTGDAGARVACGVIG